MKKYLANPGLSALSRMVLISILLSAGNIFCNKVPIQEPRPRPGPGGNKIAPVANAGQDSTVYMWGGVEYTLDGSHTKGGSTDIVSYSWKKVSGPAITIISGSGIYVSAQLSSPGIYEFMLTVTDQNGLTSTDTVVINAKPNPDCNPNRVTADLQGTLVDAPGFQDDWQYLGASEDRIYFSTLYSRSELKVFNWALKKWSTIPYVKPNLSMDKFYATGSFIFFLYLNEAGLSERISILNTSDNSWTSVPLSEPRSNCTITQLGNKLFVAGGRIGFGGYSDKVDIYDMATGNMSVTKISSARYDMVALTDGDNVYFGGGADGVAPSKRIDIYNVSAGKWSSVNMQEGRRHFTGWKENGKLYWAGGLGSTGPLYSVDVLDIASGNFSRECLSKPRFWENSFPSLTVPGGVFCPVVAVAGQLNAQSEYEMLSNTNLWYAGKINNPNSRSGTVALGLIKGEIFQVVDDDSDDVTGFGYAALKIYRITP